MVVHPLLPGRQVFRGAGRIVMPVNVEADHVRLPLYGEYMKIVGKASVSRQRVGCADAVRARVTWPVDRAVDRGRFFADVFHDVNLAPVRPTYLIRIVA